MKKALILLAIIAIFSTGLHAVTKTDWEAYYLKGKVKTMSALYNTYIFSPTGYLESMTYYYDEYSNGEVNYTYTSDGKLASIEDVDSWEGTISETRYTYDAAGLMSEITRDDISSTEVTKLSYNDKKQNTWSKTYDLDGVLKHATEYINDKNGNHTRESHYDKDMKLSWAQEYTYDKNGNVLETRKIDSDNQLTKKIIYAYNSKKQLSEEMTYEGTVLTYKCHNVYDAQGNLIEKIITEPVIGTTSQEIREYQYDEQGNWLKFDVYLDGALEQSDSRTISYYEN